MKFVSERDLGADHIVPGHRYLLSWVRPYIENKKVLDVGCWTGPLEALLEKENCEVTAIDIEEEPLKIARKRFPRFKFIKASITERLPFKTKFDSILLFMVIEHIPKGTEFESLRNLNRTLKRGGNLFLTTMHNNLLSNLLDPAYIFGHRHYSEEKLKSLLRRTGFEMKEVNYNGGFFTTIHILLVYFFKHILRRPEPRGKILDKLMEFDYKNRGFAEIDVRAIKIRNA